MLVSTAEVMSTGHMVLLMSMVFILNYGGKPCNLCAQIWSDSAKSHGGGGGK